MPPEVETEVVDDDKVEDEDVDTDVDDDDDSEDDSEPTLEESQSENASLRAILSSLNADIDIDAELDNVATKRDGTLIYVGEVKGSEGKEGEGEGKQSATKVVTRKKKPAERRAAGGKQKRDVKGLVEAARSLNAGGM